MKNKFHFELEYDIGNTVVYEGINYIIVDFIKTSPYMGYKYLLKGLNKWVYQTLLTKYTT